MRRTNWRADRDEPDSADIGAGTVYDAGSEIAPDFGDPAGPEAEDEPDDTSGPRAAAARSAAVATLPRRTASAAGSAERVPGPAAPHRVGPPSRDRRTDAQRLRARRNARLDASVLTATGAPIRSALGRVPLVGLTILMLGGAIAAVLALSTVSDADSLKATQSRIEQQGLHQSIQAAQQEVAALGALPRVAAAASSLGLVPAGDAPMLMISGTSTTLLGTPSAVPTPTTTPAAPTTPATSTKAVAISGSVATTAHPPASSPNPSTGTTPLTHAPSATSTAAGANAPTTKAPTSTTGTAKPTTGAGASGPARSTVGTGHSSSTVATHPGTAATTGGPAAKTTPAHPGSAGPSTGSVPAAHTGSTPTTGSTAITKQGETHR